jgi:hypothetical protein
MRFHQVQKWKISANVMAEFLITDFRYNKFPKILMGINMVKFQDFFFFFYGNL